MSFVPETTEEKLLLRKACRLWYLQTGFTSADSKAVEATPEALVALLEAVSGEKVQSAVDLRALVNKARRMQLNRKLPPVHVVWMEGEHRLKGRHLRAYLPLELSTEPLEIEIRLESGALERFQVAPKLHATRRLHFEGKEFLALSIPIECQLPTGYHHLKMNLPAGSAEPEATCFIMCAQREVGGQAPKARQKKWGLFAPLYGLRSESDWGIGDLGELEQVQEMIHEQGGDFLGTLPMLSTNCESADCDPSPYSPVSRLFWNEIYLDVPSLINRMDSARARQKCAEATFQAQLEKLRKTDIVDHAAVYRAKKEILEILAEEFFASGLHKSSAYHEFHERMPELEDYANFRAKGNDAEKRYHRFVQFEMDSAMARNHERSRHGRIAGLYLDFPVGVSRGGFDSSEFAESFVLDASAGAPPDLFFSAGQDWGFAPLHPIHLRETGYEYFIKCIRHHMQYAAILRLDHIMAFHRIYAIPNGFKPKNGSYIRYNPGEFYALLSIEAERAGVRVIGEDLGTVPAHIREALKEHDCLRMWVLPFEAGEKPSTALELIPECSLACLNTHDMVPFAGLMQARDAALFAELSVVDPEQGLAMTTERKETAARWFKDLKVESNKEDTFEVQSQKALIGFLRKMAESPAEVLLINAEDLWGEKEPQNIPGTWREYPNWRRKLRYAAHDWTSDPKMKRLLEDVAFRRKPEGSKIPSPKLTTGNEREHGI